jgi:chorismate dehydratase
LEQKIKVGVVSYLNTLPLLYGMEHSPLLKEMELVIDYPSRIAALLLGGEIDLGLVPVAIIPKMATPYIITDYCIGTEGEVASVALFSEVSIAEIDSILLDYQSRTSVALTRVLLEHYWKLSPQLVDTKEDFRHLIKGRTAGLVIGDRAFEQRKISPFLYDLGSAWNNFTGLPFVFAAWVANKALPDGFIAAFNAANAHGLAHINEVIAANPYPLFDLHAYYTKHISYQFDRKKREGLEKFLAYIS